MDEWVAYTKNRCGTFDFGLRADLARIVEDGGFFKMGTLPDSQQTNRMKTVPFINNHDTWRGWFWDSNPGSNQEFEMDDDLGDSQPSSLRYGGKIVAGEYRTAGAVWAAKDTLVRIWLYTNGPRDARLRILNPAPNGQKATDQSWHAAAGAADDQSPLYLEFTADREGYHQLSGSLDEGEAPSRAWLKVEYEAPAESDKF